MAGRPKRRAKRQEYKEEKKGELPRQDRLKNFQTAEHLPIPGTDPFTKTFENKTRRVADIAAELGVSPERTLLLIADGDSKALGYHEKFKIPVECRAKAASDLMTFMHPRVQAIAIAHMPEGGIEKAMRMLPEERARRIKELTAIVHGTDALQTNGKANGHDDEAA